MTHEEKAERQIKRYRLYEIISVGNNSDVQSSIFDMLLVFFIILSIAVAFIETFDWADKYETLFNVLEAICVIFFTLEYAARVWTADFLYRGHSRSWAMTRYIFSFTGIIDLLSFLPWYLPVFFPAGIVVFRMFRVIRILRLFRINAYSDSLSIINDVLRAKKNQLISSVFIIFLLMMASSIMMYSLEHNAQPEVFRNALSGLWWAASTLLTVGYGDIYPITLAGRILGVIITFLGVGMVAIPTGIISAGFVEQYSKARTFRDDLAAQNLTFVKLEITEGHPWENRAVKDIKFPPGMLLIMLQRIGNIVVPKGDTVIQDGDIAIIGAESYSGSDTIKLRETVLEEGHKWIGKQIKDLNISRFSVIVMIRRADKNIIPTGNTVLEEGDILLLYSKLYVPDSSPVTV